MPNGIGYVNLKRAEKVIKVPQRAWWGDVEMELSFPLRWDVIECRMNGHDAPILGEDGYHKAFASPIGCRPIRELAQNKKNVVILFDDMSRPTKAAEIVPFILEELMAAGVEEDRIQFICALGSHGPLTALDFTKKLGADIVARFNIYNHNIYENCTWIGKTSRGTPLSLNTEFVNADFKVGIGCIVPHINVGFGGGGKIVLPGIASIEAIMHNHGFVRNHARQTGIESDTGLGQVENNAQLLDVEEACKMSGLDIKIDTVVNIYRETTALFVGEPIAEYYEGVKLAKKHYRSDEVENPDIVIANCNAKGNETVIAFHVAESLLSDSGGTLVLITDNPVGEVCHYLRRSFGNNIGGRLWKSPSLSRKIKKFILLMPHMNKTSADWFAPADLITWAKDWYDVRSILEIDYPHAAKIALIPDATIQYFGIVTKSPYVGDGSC